MNRLKREIRKRGVKLECDYPTLPYNGIETVKVDSETATVGTWHICVGWTYVRFNRDMTFIAYHK